MKKIVFVFLLFSVTLTAAAQKKNKGKNAPPPTDYNQPDSTAPVAPPVSKKSKGKSKSGPVTTDYQQPTPVADTLTKFKGVIKYRITTDDPADNDSMIIVFGDHQIRITMFIPGSRADQMFENTFIANVLDSSFILLDKRTKTYKTEKISTRNAGTEFELGYFKKNSQILKFFCREFSGQMKTPDGEMYEAAALVSNQHSFISTVDYNFLNIQPVVLGYKIVLGWRTKTAANENTYIVAYKIEPGDTAPYFDLSEYRPK
ncbi:MAG: hypothetical protein ABL876_15545 [Chitinophagaceae bacterium]